MYLPVTEQRKMDQLSHIEEENFSIMLGVAGIARDMKFILPISHY